MKMNSSSRAKPTGAAKSSVEGSASSSTQETREERYARYCEAANRGEDIGCDPEFTAMLLRGDHLNDKFLAGINYPEDGPFASVENNTREAVADDGRVVAVFLQERGDGGLRVWSNDEPGLILSGRNAAKVASDIWPAIKALQAYRRSS